MVETARRTPQSLTRRYQLRLSTTEKGAIESRYLKRRKELKEILVPEGRKVPVGFRLWPTNIATDETALPKKYPSKP